MMIYDHFDARSLLFFNCYWCHLLNLIFVTSAFHILMPQECVCVCVCVCGGGGYSGIFIYIRRLGPFLGVQNLEFQYFLFFFFLFLGGGGGGGGGVQKYHYFFWGGGV